MTSSRVPHRWLYVICSLYLPHIDGQTTCILKRSLIFLMLKSADLRKKLTNSIESGITAFDGIESRVELV